MMDFLTQLRKSKEEGRITEKLSLIFYDLYSSYFASLPPEIQREQYIQDVFLTFLQKVEEEMTNRFTFQPFHRQITAPFDYYNFGLDFCRPLVDHPRTWIDHPEILDEIEKVLNKGENAILYANHQTEIDPQAISIALEKTHPRIGKELIFVAGDRVITDPMAIPFSMGRNLLCIYSKRHIANPPERKEEKLKHNQRTMRVMKDLLSEGSKCIYVAPSGGRDRADPVTKEVKVAPFDPNNIEMFRLMASGAKTPTHFYPLALSTYEMLPPPLEVESEIGEMRSAKYSPVLLSFGKEIDMERLHEEIKDKHARREASALHIWKLVSDAYNTLLKRK